jgi:two-component system response regulator VicR
VTEKIKILIVEDDGTIRKYVKFLLERESYEVSAAAGVREAKSILVDFTPDLVVLDLMLPDGSGKELCLKLRENEKYKDVGIIVLSGMSTTDTKIDLIEIGADDYLTKPFSSDELLARIKVLLRRYKKNVNEIFRYSNLEIQPHDGIVSLNGKRVALDDKEYRMLLFIIKRTGKLVPWEYFRETIWNQEWVDKGMVDKNMKQLAEKLVGWDHEIIMDKYGYICSKERR